MKRYLLLLTIGCFYSLLNAQIETIKTQKNLSVKAVETLNPVYLIQGGKVAATPISIPRPIRLEKIEKLADYLPKTTTYIPFVSQNMPKTDNISTCELLDINGNIMQFRLHYTIDSNRQEPIYAGIFLYNSNLQAINAGYLPAALLTLPDGSVDVTVVLPQEKFSASYLVAFLMESDKPVFVNGRFQLVYHWQGNYNLQADKEKFCRDYTEEAINQYHFALQNKLPEIVPPVWTDEASGHYNWCMRVSKQQAIGGSELRKTHIKKHSKIAISAIQTPQLFLIQELSLKALKEQVIMPKSGSKQLDPGLGP